VLRSNRTDDSTPDEKLAYSVTELAEATSLSRSKLFADIAAGKGPRAKQADGRIIVLRDDAIAWLYSLPTVQPEPA
jgi:hypothetical protein